MTDKFSLRAALGGPAATSDRELVWVLVAIGVVDVCATAYFSLVPVRLGFLYSEFASYVASVFLQGVPFLRLWLFPTTPYSLAGVFWVMLTVFAFIVWNLAITIIASWTRWWTYQPPYTFDISVILGLAPVMIGIASLNAKVRAIER